MTRWATEAIEEASCIATPARSTLYGLKLSGDAGGTREGLLEYAQRLAHEHHLHARALFAQIILPEAQIQGAFFVPGHFSAHALQGCNGWSSYAMAFTAAMQRLTGRMDVARGSMTGWRDLLSDKGYASKNRKWCRECLREQAGTGVIFRLLWSFDPVRVCPLHEVDLVDTCHYCGAHQPIIDDALAEGLCFRCGRGLWDGESERAHSSVTREVFIGRALLSMISASDLAAEIAQPARYFARLRAAAMAACGGSLWKLERMLGLSDGLLRLSGRRRLSLFLEVAYRLGADPVAFLREGQADEAASMEAAPRHRVVRHYSNDDVDRIRQQAQVSLAEALSREDQMTTRAQFAKRVGINVTSLGSLLAGEVEALSAHNERIRVSVRRRRRRLQCKLVREAMLELRAKGGPYNSTSIRHAMHEKGVHPRDGPMRRMARRMLRILLAQEVNFTLIG